MSNLLLNVVIIAKLNTSLKFLRTLKSILNQSYAPIKVSVVDINEQNSIYSLGLQEDLSVYPEVEYIKIDQSYTMAEIRNYMLEHVKGEYIAFMNDSDTWDLNMALSQISQLEANPEAVAICSNGALIDERKANIHVEPLIDSLARNPSKWILFSPVKMSAQMIYLNKAVKAAGGFDEQFEGLFDADMVLRLSKQTKVLITRDSLCKCRITPNHKDYDLNLYLDYKKFRMKYLESFIANRRIAYVFYKRMIKLAKINYMWLDYLIYIVLYFLKAPLRTIHLQLNKIGRFLGFTMQWIRRECSIYWERIRTRFHLYLISKGKQSKEKQSLFQSFKAINPEQKVTFLTAKQYNEQSPLKYVFNKKLRSIVISKNFTVIKKGMFYGCENLVSIEIPYTVRIIEAHAFQKCRNLRYVIIQEGSRLTKIGDYAFAGCESLNKLTLPSSIDQIGAYAFAECYSIKQMMFTNLVDNKVQYNSIFPKALEKIPRYAFAGCRNLLTVEFGANSMLEVIEDGAFLGCNNLTALVLTGKLKSIGAYALACCNKLETVAILQLDDLVSIGKCALMFCESLLYFQIPSKIERIRARTFYGCSKLKFMKIPNRVLSINHQAFTNCPSLKNVIILTGDIVISPSAFDRHTEIEILENVKHDNYFI